MAEEIMRHWRDEREACGNSRGPKLPHPIMRAIYPDFTMPALNLGASVESSASTIRAPNPSVCM